jgi:hypothetical protein
MRSQQPLYPATCYCHRKIKSMWAAVLLKKDGCSVRMLATLQPFNDPHSKLEPLCGYPFSTSRQPTETKVNYHGRKQTLPTWAMWCLYDELGIRPTWRRPRCRYLYDAGHKSRFGQVGHPCLPSCLAYGARITPDQHGCRTRNNQPCLSL